MTLRFDNEEEYDLGFDLYDTAEMVIKAALDEENFEYEIEVGLTLVSLDAIHELNKEFRQIDKPTDVLSFPLINYKAPGNFEGIADNEDNISPETGEIMLGDIVLCIPRVISQAEEYGHSVKREYSFLISHSMLHLMGYDHIDDQERRVMEDKQELILNNLGISRGES
jgi:probable rRNA maturation factor